MPVEIVLLNTKTCRLIKNVCKINVRACAHFKMATLLKNLVYRRHEEIFNLSNVSGLQGS